MEICTFASNSAEISSVADLGGALGARPPPPPPPGTQILLISCSFRENLAKSYVVPPPPPRGVGASPPPPGKILDPPLFIKMVCSILFGFQHRFLVLKWLEISASLSKICCWDQKFVSIPNLNRKNTKRKTSLWVWNIQISWQRVTF